MIKLPLLIGMMLWMQHDSRIVDFSSVRHGFPERQVQGYHSFKIRLGGDGNKYQFRARSDPSKGHAYAYTIQTDRTWQTILGPVAKMYFTWRGMKLNISNYPGSTLSEIVFLVGNKKNEEFRLEIDSVMLVGRWNGSVIQAISRAPRVMRCDNLDESCQLKAQECVQSCTKTIHAFIDPPEWFGSSTRLFHFPENSRYDECLPGVRGLTSACNRQLIMAAGMLNVVKCDERTGEEAALRSRYTAIVDSIVNYIWNSVTPHGSGDVTYYLWMYREEGKDGGPPRMEDIGHGAADIIWIVQIHVDLGIGTAEQLSRANL